MSQPAIPDTESLGWHRALSGTGSGRQHAVERLHALLLRAARFEVARRRRTVDEDLDDLAVQAADDALLAIMSRLHTYRGDTRFTTGRTSSPSTKPPSRYANAVASHRRR